MKNYIRFIWKGFAPGLLLAVILGTSPSNATVLTLDFTDGNGTTSVDQFNGVAGSGWKAGWTSAAGTSITSTMNTVTNTSPLYTGGGNYLSSTFTVSGVTTANQWERATRQLDSTAINLNAALTYSFVFRSDSILSNANESITIFSANGPNPGTGSGDTWKITGGGAGWVAFYGNGTSTPSGSITLGTLGTSSMATSYQFTIYSDPTTQMYNVTITNLSNSTTTSSGLISWRAITTTENSYFDILASSGSTISGQSFGYSIDNISVVPEPASVALFVASSALLIVLGKKYRPRFF